MSLEGLDNPFFESFLNGFVFWIWEEEVSSFLQHDSFFQVSYSDFSSYGFGPLSPFPLNYVNFQFGYGVDVYAQPLVFNVCLNDNVTVLSVPETPEGFNSTFQFL